MVVHGGFWIDWQSDADTRYDMKKVGCVLRGVDVSAIAANWSVPDLDTRRLVCVVSVIPGTVRWERTHDGARYGCTADVRNLGPVLVAPPCVVVAESEVPGCVVVSCIGELGEPASVDVIRACDEPRMRFTGDADAGWRLVEPADAVPVMRDGVSLHTYGTRAMRRFLLQWAKKGDAARRVQPKRAAAPREPAVDFHGSILDYGRVHGDPDAVRGHKRVR